MKTKNIKRDSISPRIIRLLNEILDHQIANRGTTSKFYRCYTYPFGNMPAWVKKAEDIVKSQ